MIISIYVLIQVIQSKHLCLTLLQQIFKKCLKNERKDAIHILFSTISNIKRARTNKWWRVVLSRKPVCFGISKLILQFLYSFHIPYTILSTVYFHTVLLMFFFVFYWSHLKVGAFPSSNPSLFRKRSVKYTSCNSWKWRAIHLE